MNDYNTPTDREIMDAWLLARVTTPIADIPKGELTKHRAEYLRWLAAHDAAAVQEERDTIGAWLDELADMRLADEPEKDVLARAATAIESGTNFQSPGPNVSEGPQTFNRKDTP